MRAEPRVDDAVDVVHGEAVVDSIGVRPSPAFAQARGLRVQGRAGVKRGFRSAGGAGREDDERAVRGRLEVRRGVDAGGDASEVEGYRGRVRVASGMDRGDARDGDGARDSVHRGAERVRGEDDIDARLGEAVRELGGGCAGARGPPSRPCATQRTSRRRIPVRGAPSPRPSPGGGCRPRRRGQTRRTSRPGKRARRPRTRSTPPGGRRSRTQRPRRRSKCTRAPPARRRGAPPRDGPPPWRPARRAAGSDIGSRAVAFRLMTPPVSGAQRQRSSIGPRDSARSALGRFFAARSTPTDVPARFQTVDSKSKSAFGAETRGNQLFGNTPALVRCTLDVTWHTHARASRTLNAPIMLTEVKANVAPTPGMIKPSELKCTSPRPSRRCASRASVWGAHDDDGIADGRRPARGRKRGKGDVDLQARDDEKENIDPATGMHARLASGASAACRGAENGACRALFFVRASSPNSNMAPSSAFSSSNLTSSSPIPAHRRRYRRRSRRIRRGRTYPKCGTPSSGGHHPPLRPPGALEPPRRHRRCDFQTTTTLFPARRL